MIVQKIFYQFLRFKNFYDSVYQSEFFEVASFNTGFYGGHNYKRAPYRVSLANGPKMSTKSMSSA